jgi:hypothetical protein
VAWFNPKVLVAARRPGLFWGRVIAAGFALWNDGDFAGSIYIDARNFDAG